MDVFTYVQPGIPSYLSVKSPSSWPFFSSLLLSHLHLPPPVAPSPSPPFPLPPPYLLLPLSPSQSPPCWTLCRRHINSGTFLYSATTCSYIHHRWNRYGRACTRSSRIKKCTTVNMASTQSSTPLPIAPLQISTFPLLPFKSPSSHYHLPLPIPSFLSILPASPPCSRPLPVPPHCPPSLSPHPILLTLPPSAPPRLHLPTPSFLSFLLVQICVLIQPFRISIQLFASSMCSSNMSWITRGRLLNRELYSTWIWSDNSREIVL